jgi:hypothetical protein
VALFLTNPVVEQIEMSLIHGAGAAQGTWARFAHDALLVLEEGLLELFGTVCFLMATLVWLRGHALATTGIAGPALTARIHPEIAARAGLTAAGITAAGIALSAVTIPLLPDADSGLAINWFPAASGFLLFLLALGARAAMPREPSGPRRMTEALAILALAVSAYFGAGIYGYADWGDFDAVRELLRTVLAVGFAIVCVALSRTPQGDYIGAMIVAAVLMPCAINITGPHATLAASLAALAAATAIAAAPQALIAAAPPQSLTAAIPNR